MLYILAHINGLVVALHAERCKQAFSSSSVTSQPSSLASEGQVIQTEHARSSSHQDNTKHALADQHDTTGPLYSTTFEPATPTIDQVITQATNDRSFDPDSLQAAAGAARDSDASTDSLSCVSMEEEEDSSLVFTSASVSQQSQKVELDDTAPEDIEPAVSVCVCACTLD